MHRIFLFALILSFPSLCLFAGGVTGGGGGTTNPNPSTAEEVATVVDDSFLSIAASLNQKEYDYLLLDRGSLEEINWPFRKIFQNEKDVFALLKHLEIELKMTDSCYDGEGKPVDGSMYASKPGAICISPFRIAPKVNAYNVQSETMALIFHEISHLFGTTEEEAIAIQLELLENFSERSQSDLKRALSDVWGAFSQLVSDHQRVVKLSPNLRQADLLPIGKLLVEAFDFSRGRYREFSFIRSLSFAKLFTETFRHQISSDFVCAKDNQLSDEARAHCASNSKKILHGKSIYSFKYEIKTFLGLELAPAEFMNLYRIKDSSSLKIELLKTQSVLHLIHLEQTNLGGRSFLTYRSL